MDLNIVRFIGDHRRTDHIMLYYITILIPIKKFAILLSAICSKGRKKKEEGGWGSIFLA